MLALLPSNGQGLRLLASQFNPLGRGLLQGFLGRLLLGQRNLERKLERLGAFLVVR